MHGGHKLAAITFSLGLVLAGCGSDDDADTDATGDTTAETSGAVQVSVAEGSLEVPSEIAGGVVDFEFESGSEEGEINFTRVKSGTSEDTFKADVIKLVSGGPFPEYIEGSVGIIATEAGTTMASLEMVPGSYIAWSIPEGDEGGEAATAEPGAASTTTAAGAEGGEGDQPSPDDVLTSSLTVTEGEGGTLPAGEGTITAKDYSFDVSVQAGEQFVFRNTGPAQFHHAIVFNFGMLDPKVVEENLPKFLESEETDPPPDAFKDLDFENLEAGGSGVMGPANEAGTFRADLTAGNTYAVVCFIADRAGGPPHAFAHGMSTVFQVG